MLDHIVDYTGLMKRSPLDIWLRDLAPRPCSGLTGDSEVS